MEVEIVKKLLTVACGREASKMVEYYSFDSAFDPFENTFIAWIAHEVLHKRSQKLWKTAFTCCKLRTLFRKLIEINFPFSVFAMKFYLIELWRRGRGIGSNTAMTHYNWECHISIISFWISILIMFGCITRHFLDTSNSFETWF